MKKNNNTGNEEMFEFNNLIQKEKEDALQSFREEDFRSRLSQIIEKESKTPVPTVYRLRKLVFAVSAVLLLIVLGWVATQIFTPTPYERDARAIEKTLVQALEVHELLVALSIPQIEPRPVSGNLYEFEWSIKRVIYSVQREDIPDSDVPEILSQVLQKVIQVEESEDKAPSGLSPKGENGFLMKENNFYRSFSQN